MAETSNKQQAEALKLQANTAFSEKDWARATELYTEAIGTHRIATIATTRLLY